MPHLAASRTDSSIPLSFVTLNATSDHSKTINPGARVCVCGFSSPWQPWGKVQKHITATCLWPLRACLWLLMLSAENCPGRSPSSLLVCPGLSTSSNFCFKGTVGELPVFQARIGVQPSSLCMYVFFFFFCLPCNYISAASTYSRDSAVELELEGNLYNDKMLLAKYKDNIRNFLEVTLYPSILSIYLSIYILPTQLQWKAWMWIKIEVVHGGRSQVWHTAALLCNTKLATYAGLFHHKFWLCVKMIRFYFAWSLLEIALMYKVVKIRDSGFQLKCYR